MAEVSVLFLGDWLENDVSPHLGFASSERQAAVARFRFASDKNRSLWAELFARWRLAEATGLSPAEIEISHDEKGKPFCKNLPFSVSLSHSGAYIAVAVGKSAVGVDVERKRKISLAVSRRWFRPEEHEFLTSLPEEERARAFFRFWTLKEAALLAAWYSKGQNSSTVPVDYTLRRYVKKPGGSAPGFVIYTHQRTLYMTATEQDIRAIRQAE